MKKSNRELFETKIESRIEKIEKEFDPIIQQTNELVETRKEIKAKLAKFQGMAETHSSQIEDHKATVAGLRKEIPERILEGKDTSELSAKIREFETKIKDLRGVVSEIESIIIPETSNELQKVESKLFNSVHNGVIGIGSVYQNKINETIKNSIEVDLRAWDMAVRELHRTLKLNRPLDKPIRIKFNRVLAGHTMPPH